MHEDDQQPLYVQIRDILAHAIETGELAAGARITESSIASRFGVSRQTARHALRELHSRRLTRSQAGRRGFVISPPGHGSTDKQPIELKKENRWLLEGYEVNRSPKWEQKYDRIKSELLTLSCKGDYRIIPSNLADSHGISRTILKDVQLRLVDDGIVRVEGRNWILNRFDFVSITEQFSVRMILEPHALKTGFSSIDPDEAALCLARLEEAKQRQGELNSDQLERLEDDLHVQTLSKCNNAFLMDVLRRSRLVHVFNSYYFPRFHPQNLFVDEHIAIFEAILRHDVEGAAAALVRHLDASAADTCHRVEKFAAASQNLRVSYVRSVQTGATAGD